MSYQLPTRSLVKNDQNMMVARPDVPRSRFLGSWTRNTTFDAGLLVPFMVEEVLPGDHLKYDVTAYVRMSTPLFPLFDNQIIETFFFFVPNRIVWRDWVKFMGEVDVNESPYDYEVPTLAFQRGAKQNSLADHFGLPTHSAALEDPDYYVLATAFPFRAYDLIWNEWFRDQNIQPRVTQAADVQNQVINYPDEGPALLRRNKMHDYFTSCLPWPTKFPSADVPINGRVPVTGIGYPAGTSWNSGPSAPIFESDRSTSVYNYYTTATPTVSGTGNGAGGSDVYPQIYVDLAQAGGVGLRALRAAWMVQQLTERDARGGTRYTEVLKAHFGIDSPDSRLQRPEYIGGGRSPLQVTPIAQTVSTVDVPLGALGGAGTAVGRHSASYSSVEHGFIIGLINVQTELSYSQGIHRMWDRRSRYDYYWPSLAHLGEQAVRKYELVASDVTFAAQNAGTGVFGYQERWHEYRSRYSEVTGRFRPNATLPLDGWHLSQYLTNGPVLNSGFIEDYPPMARVLAAGVQSEQQQYLANILIRRDAVRPLPVYSTPAQLGRF